MKTNKYIFMTIFCTLMFTVPSIVVAQSMNVSGQSQASDHSPSAGFVERLQRRKEKATRHYTAPEQNIIKSRCEATQKLIASSAPGAKRFVITRLRLYENLTVRIESLNTKLKASNAVTGSYSEQVENLKKKVNAYSINANSLLLAYEDIKEIDCTTDPEGFAVTLLNAIALRTNVIEGGKEIRLYLKDNLKSALMELTKQIKAKAEHQGVKP